MAYILSVLVFLGVISWLISGYITKRQEDKKSLDNNKE